MKYIYIISAIIFLASCSNPSGNAEETKTNNSVQESPTDLVVFTAQQIELAEIKTGPLATVSISEEISCTGVIEASPENMAKVSVPSEAYIDKIFKKHGTYVTKGEAVLTIKHNDFIDLQSNYLKLKNELKYKSEEYQRQKRLYNENAVSKKKFNQVELDYNTSLIEEKNLEQKLLLLGLNPKQLTTESISSVIKLKAPISGYIDEIFVSAGQFLEPKDVLFEMINTSDFILMLSVYGKYKSTIKIGDQVQFKPCDANCDPVFAKIFSVGHIIEEKTKTFRVHAQPEALNTKLTTGAFINARILVNSKEVLAVPNNAIVSNADGNFVFVSKTDSSFQLTKVEIGTENSTYTEIKTVGVLKDQNIVLAGANYLYSKL